jgi:hypothetical protein
MEFLFGNQNNCAYYPYVEGAEYKYRAWEENNTWRQQLQVKGRKAGSGNAGFVRSSEIEEVVITLVDEEVMLWEHLDLAKRGVGPGNLGGFFVFLSWLFCLSLLVLSVIITLTTTVLDEYPWYLTSWLYLLAPVIAFGLISAYFITKEKIVHTKRKKILRTFLKNLQSKSGRDSAYYRNILQAISNANNKERAKNARMLLNEGLV